MASQQVDPTLKNKPDWPAARAAHEGWWAGKAMAPCVFARKDDPPPQAKEPPVPEDLKMRWCDPGYRVRREIARKCGLFYGGAAFPCFDADIGPGSLGLFLGCEGVLAADTVWYKPVIEDPEAYPPLKFTRNKWWDIHVAMLQAAIDANDGLWTIGCPDLIENIDTLAQLREGQLLLVDLLERPQWVRQKLHEINCAFFECYEALWPMLADPWGGSVFRAFGLWGKGRVAKVQCDFSCMISGEMFRQFVVPPLAEQCRWLDRAMYHLDGTQAMHHLPALLEIEALQAIEWTPQAGAPGGGDPCWYDLYRRIRRGGKSVQAVGVRPEQVEPLIDAVGPEGLQFVCWCKTQAEARRLLERIGWKEQIA